MESCRIDKANKLCRLETMSLKCFYNIGLSIYWIINNNKTGDMKVAAHKKTFQGTWLVRKWQVFSN